MNNAWTKFKITELLFITYDFQPKFSCNSIFKNGRGLLSQCAHKRIKPLWYMSEQNGLYFFLSP